MDSVSDSPSEVIFDRTFYIACRYIDIRYTDSVKADDSRQSRTMFLVLLALSNDPMHGYEISKFIESKTNGFFRVPFGSLYPVLHRLEAEKMIQAKWVIGDSQKQKKTYTLTARGRKSLRGEIDLFRSLAGAINLLSAVEIK